MLYPVIKYRLTALQVYHHPALQPEIPSEVVTPHFVREAATYDAPTQPLPPIPTPPKQKEKEKAVKRKTKKREDGIRASTPTALGESIRQHTSIGKVQGKRIAVGDAGKENAMGLVDVVRVGNGETGPSPGKDKAVIRMSKAGMLEVEAKNEEDPTRELLPTKTSPR
jgi:hypothetical protein